MGLFLYFGLGHCRRQRWDSEKKAKKFTKEIQSHLDWGNDDIIPPIDPANLADPCQSCRSLPILPSQISDNLGLSQTISDYLRLSEIRI